MVDSTILRSNAELSTALSQELRLSSRAGGSKRLQGPIKDMGYQDTGADSIALDSG